MNPTVWPDKARDPALHTLLHPLPAAAQGFLLPQPGPSLLPGLQQAAAAANALDVDRLMRAATQVLLQWQLENTAPAGLPALDEAAVGRELQVFVDACVGSEFGRQWDATQQGWWAHSCKVLAGNMAAQPQVALHRDFTPRSLVLGAAGDAAAPASATGPISYDLVSLLRDAFIAWEEEQELDWAIRYWEQARKAGLPASDDFGTFWQQLEWTGLQRHLAMLGDFCQRKHRDGQPAAAEEALPRLFAYAIKVSTRYVQLSPLTHLLQDLQGSLVQTGFTLR